MRSNSWMWACQTATSISTRSMQMSTGTRSPSQRIIRERLRLCGGHGFTCNPAGRTGTVHVLVGKVSMSFIRMTTMRTTPAAFSLPTWFGSQYVTGDTDLTVTFHLPPGVKPEEPRWHAAPSGFPSEPQTAFDTDGRVTYTWRNPNASADTQYTFGASFPKELRSSRTDCHSAIAIVLDFLGCGLRLAVLRFHWLHVPGHADPGVSQAGAARCNTCRRRSPSRVTASSAD